MKKKATHPYAYFRCRHVGRWNKLLLTQTTAFGILDCYTWCDFDKKRTEWVWKTLLMLFNRHSRTQPAAQAACKVDHREAQSQHNRSTEYSFIRCQAKTLLGEGGQVQQGSANGCWNRVGPMLGHRWITLWRWNDTQNTQSLFTVTVIVVIFCSRP